MFKLYRPRASEVGGAVDLSNYAIGAAKTHGDFILTDLNIVVNQANRKRVILDHCGVCKCVVC